MTFSRFNPDDHSGPLPSPCIGLCTVDFAGSHCVGCGRTLDEIGAWPAASEAYKRVVWQRLRQRTESAAGEA